MTIYLTECNICRKQTESIRKLSKHIRDKHDISIKEYYDKFIKKENEDLCVVCNKTTTYRGLGEGYLKVCSHSCSCIQSRRNLKNDTEKHQSFVNKVRINQSRIWKERGAINAVRLKISKTLIEKNSKLTDVERIVKYSRYSTCDEETIKRLNKIGRKQCLKNWSTGMSGYRKCHKGKYTPKFPKKYKGDVNNIIFRSGYELRVMQYLDTNSNVIEWNSEEVQIPYISPLDNKYHRYFPDFVIRVKLPDNSIKTYMLEVKPKSQTTEPVKRRKSKKYINEVVTWGVNEAKWEKAREYCADRGWEFLLVTEKEIFGRA